MPRNLHRRTGLSVFIFLLLFVVTGLLLQHAPRLHLGKKYIAAPVAQFLYKIEINTTWDYSTENHWISQVGGFLYLDAVHVSGIELHNLQGAVEDASYIWVAGDNKLLLLSKRGEVIEQFSALEGLPGIVSRIGKDPQGAIIVGGLYDDNWQATEGLPEWQPYEGTQVIWSQGGEDSHIPEQFRVDILKHARNSLISWERLLVDLHSGRLFGKVGIIIADLMALLFLFLSGTGIMLWHRGR